MSKTNGKVMQFLKQNLAYLVLAFCILAIGLTVLFVMIGEQNTIPAIQTDIEAPSDEDPSSQNGGDSTKVTFIIPVKEYDSYLDYSDKLVYYSTLSNFSGHKAIDFYGAEGTEVYAAYGGTIESITDNGTKGSKIVINHGNGLKTIYNSITFNEDLVVEQKVKQGDIIGSISTTNKREKNEGPHLHFQVMENDKIINPSLYLTIDLK